MKDRFEQVEITSRQSLRRWLEDHHTQPSSIWLVRYKKHNPDRYVPYEEIVKEALCFGWIDSHVRTLDADRSLLLLSPPDWPISACAPTTRSRRIVEAQTRHVGAEGL